MAIEILIDTDPGMGTRQRDPEDGLALLMALNSPEVEVVGVTTCYGCAPLHNTFSNASHLLDLAGRSDIPVAPGAAAPLMSFRSIWPSGHPSLPVLAGEQRAPLRDPGSAPLSATDLISTLARGSVDGLTLVTIAPLTNIAVALMQRPQLRDEIRQIVMMGGASFVRGNMTPVAEFNIWADAEAAAMVFSSGIPIRMVGLDVCHQVRLEQSELDAFGEAGPLGELAYEAFTTYGDEVADSELRDEVYLYDTLTMASVLRPQLLTSELARVDIETASDLTYGQTVTFTGHHLRGRAEPNADVALSVDVAAFKELFRERLHTVRG